MSDHELYTKLPYILPSKKLGYAILNRRIPNGEEWLVFNEKGQHVYTSGYKDVMEHQPYDS